MNEALSFGYEKYSAPCMGPLPGSIWTAQTRVEGLLNKNKGQDIGNMRCGGSKIVKGRTYLTGG